MPPAALRGVAFYKKLRKNFCLAVRATFFQEEPMSESLIFDQMVGLLTGKTILIIGSENARLPGALRDNTVIHLADPADFRQISPVHDKSIDVAMFLSGLRHLLNPGKLLLEIHRTLTDDGLLLAAGPGTLPYRENPIDNNVRLPDRQSWERLLGHRWEILSFNGPAKAATTFVKARKSHSMKTVKADAFVLSYKREENLPAVIRGLKRQSFVDNIYIIHNHPSKRKVDGAINIFSQKNFRCIARHSIAQLAENEYVLFMDDDLELMTDLSPRFIQALETEPEAVAGLLGNNVDPGAPARQLYWSGGKFHEGSSFQRFVDIVIGRCHLCKRKYLGESFKFIAQHDFPIDNFTVIRDDVILNLAAQLQTKVPGILVPAQIDRDFKNLPEPHAVWKMKSHFAIRSSIIKYFMDNGWTPRANTGRFREQNMTSGREIIEDEERLKEMLMLLDDSGKNFKKLERLFAGLNDINSVPVNFKTLPPHFIEDEKRLAAAQNLFKELMKTYPPAGKSSEVKTDIPGADEKIAQYLAAHLPAPGEPIPDPMHPGCQLVFVIPAYGERDCILRPLESLAGQQDVDFDCFEVIVVVNNPGREPGKSEHGRDDFYEEKVKLYREAVRKNRETLDLIEYIRGQRERDGVNLKEDEEGIVEKLRTSPMRLYAIDKASPGKTLPAGHSTAGGARNRGIAEAVARFYKQVGRNGIIAHVDADTRVAPHYARTVIDMFEQRPDLTGIAGGIAVEYGDEPGDLLPIALRAYDGEQIYEKLLKALFAQNKRQKYKMPMRIAGANTAARAFETAIAGGAPTQIAENDNYDVAFFRRMTAIGSVEDVPGLVNAALIRYSPRCPHGFGLKLMKYMKSLKQNASITVRSLENEFIFEDLNREINRLITGRQLTQFNLKRILTFDNQSILTGGQLDLFCQKLREVKDFRELRFDPDLSAVFREIHRAIEVKAPAIELGPGITDLIYILCVNNEELEEKYISVKKQRIQRIREWQKIIQRVLEIFYERRPSPFANDMLLSYVNTAASELGLTENDTAELVNNSFAVDKLTQLIRASNSQEEALAAIRIQFRDHVELPGEDSLEYKFIELSAMEEAFDALYGR
jgi:glycosyltransferase involved in cell wall biosynthesis